MNIIMIIIKFIEENIPILISMFSVYLVLKRDSKSNPNITILWTNYHWKLSQDEAILKWAKKDNGSYSENGVPLFSLNYVCQNVGPEPANWGFFYHIDFENKSIYSSRPFFLIQPGEKFSIKFTSIVKKHTVTLDSELIQWNFFKMYLKMTGKLDRHNTATVLIYSDFINQKNIFILDKHNLEKFRKSSNPLNLFHPIQMWLSYFCNKQARLQDNTYEKRAHSLMTSTVFLYEDIKNKFDTVIRIDSPEKDPRNIKSTRKEENRINSKINNYI
ncbi:MULTISPECIES: hypothetical protein [Bacteria]|uniref:hypothetical protein n=1 Tax=Bacteria TaxID=2 RepID=UPI000D59ACDF|nr:MULTISPECIES: hypothetical protein [Enterococcus]EGP4965148.1 hypothetical protein [Enterococcus faecium]EGP5303157.1 hypothetical protein [Enterococcus faecium]